MKIVRGYNLDKENIEYLEEEAKKKERSVSWIINNIIKQQRLKEEK